MEQKLDICNSNPASLSPFISLKQHWTFQLQNYCFWGGLALKCFMGRWNGFCLCFLRTQSIPAYSKGFVYYLGNRLAIARLHLLPKPIFGRHLHSCTGGIIL